MSHPLRVALVIPVVKNPSQGLKARAPTSWDTERFACFRLAPNPVDDAGLLSFATFSWLTPVMVQGYQHMLTVDTLPPLSLYDSSDTNAKRYEDLFRSVSSREEPTLGRDLRALLCSPDSPWGNLHPPVSVAILPGSSLRCGLG